MDYNEFYDFEISSSQRRIYVLNKLAGFSTVYNMPSLIRLKKYIELDVIEESLKKVIARHECLRTSFIIEKGEVIQRIFKEVEFKILHFKLGDGDEIQDIVKSLIKPFVLEKAPLIRVAIIEKDNVQHLFLDMHHIISDGKSEVILMNDFYSFIDGIELSEITSKYTDCILSEKKIINNEKYMQRAKEFWLKSFSNIGEPLNLPIDFPRQEIQQFEGDRRVFAVGRELSQKVEDICKKYKVTINHYLMTIYAIMLSKISGQEDIIIGTPVSSRRNSEQEKIIGLFLNTLPIRVEVNGKKSFLELLDEVKMFNLMAMKYQNYTLDMIVNDIEFPKDLSRNPVFDVAFLYNSNIVIDPENCENYYRTESAKVDLSVEITNSVNGIRFLMEYCTKLFKPETCEKFGQLFIRVLEQVTICPEINIESIQKLTNDEKDKVLYQWNKTKFEYNKNETIGDLINKISNEKKDDISLTCMEESLTYSEMNKIINQFASFLRMKGIGRNDVVGIMMEPGIDMVLAILGIIKSGAAYLPIAVNTPEQRINFIIKDSGAKLLVLDNFYVKENNVCIFNKNDLDRYSSEIEVINRPDDLLYIIYTSGSTGNPKGVMVSHKNVVNFIHGINKAVNMSEHKKILLLTTICFDISVLEMIVSLSLGLEVFVVNKEMQNDINLLLNIVSNNNIDMLQFTPSRFQLITMVPKWEEKLAKVKSILIGGEAFPNSLLDKVLLLKNTKIYNVYGPTETTIWSTVAEISSNHITIGKPIANTQIYILDKDRNCVGIGEEGEIYIAGDGVTKGYRNNENLTREKFIINDYTGELMYSTGDIGKWNEDGTLQCLGRIDFQVKIRGYRIEIGEIEQQIQKFKGIENVVVVDYIDKNDNKYLCAYIKGSIERFEVLKRHLETTLPEYMIPSYFIKIDEIPLNNNGKVDRKKLPLPQIKKKEVKVNNIRLSLMEKRIIDVFKEVLSIEDISLQDDFFDIGGNSLLAIKADLLFEQNKIGITGQNIYQYRTVGRLAQYLEKEKVDLNDNNSREDLNYKKLKEEENIIISKDAKFIEGLEPYNELFFESCFYNSLFSILRYYGYDISHFLRNYSMRYDIKINKQKIKISGRGHWNKELTQILEIAGINVHSIYNSRQILYDIKQSIDNHNPVILWIDCFFESYRKDKYKKEHFKHTITIFGYSEESQEFYILEHKNADNTNYHKIAISFNELERCYNGYINFFSNELEDSFYEISAKDEREKYLKVLEQEKFVNSVWDKELVKKWRDYLVSLDLEKVEMTELNSWIEGLNELLNCLRTDVVKYRYHENIDIIKQRLNLWNMIRNNLLRGFYMNRYTEKIHQKNLKQLDDIISLEFNK